MAGNPALPDPARVPPPAGLTRWAPSIALLRTCQRAWQVPDLTAGLVLTTVLVPVGMAYVEAAGLPALLPDDRPGG
jgi:urea transporter